MLPTLLVFTFAASASAYTSNSAHITTSIWMYADDLLTDKIGYFGRVLKVEGDRTTMGIQPDEPTDATALGQQAFEMTVTVAPTYYAEAISLRADAVGANTDVNNVVEAARLDCIKTATGDIDAICTISSGPIFASIFECGRTYTPIGAAPYDPATEPQVITHTYPSRGTIPAGTETITRAQTTPAPVAATSTPAWCNGNGNATESKDSIHITTAPKESFFMAQVTIRWGMDLVRPASSTSLDPATLPTSSASQNGGASGPVQTVGPVFAGLAVAAALVV